MKRNEKQYVGVKFFLFNFGTNDNCNTVILTFISHLYKKTNDHLGTQIPYHSINCCSYWALGKIFVLTDSDNVGLNRDYGVAVIQNAIGPKLDIVRKIIMATFTNEVLSIIIEIHLIETDFLDGCHFQLVNRKLLFL